MTLDSAESVATFPHVGVDHGWHTMQAPALHAPVTDRDPGDEHLEHVTPTEALELIDRGEVVYNLSSDERTVLVFRDGRSFVDPPDEGRGSRG